MALRSCELGWWDDPACVVHVGHSASKPMSGKNRRLSLRNNRLKFKALGNLLTILKESIEYTSNEWKHKNRKMSTCNRLDLESLGSWPTLYAQKLPGHWLKPIHKKICITKFQEFVRYLDVAWSLVLLTSGWPSRMPSLEPLLTRDWWPVTISLEALSLVEMVELGQGFFTLHLRDQQSEWLQDGCMSTWIPTWHQMDHVSWSFGLYSKTTSWR